MLFNDFLSVLHRITADDKNANQWREFVGSSSSSMGMNIFKV